MFSCCSIQNHGTHFHGHGSLNSPVNARKLSWDSGVVFYCLQYYTALPVPGLSSPNQSMCQSIGPRCKFRSFCHFHVDFGVLFCTFARTPAHFCLLPHIPAHVPACKNIYGRMTKASHTTLSLYPPLSISLSQPSVASPCHIILTHLILPDLPFLSPPSVCTLSFSDLSLSLSPTDI